MPYVATATGTRLWYELEGPADAPVVLQFGGTVLGRRHFDGVRDRFLPEYRLLAFDPTGFGLSERPTEFYTVEGFADDAVTVLDALGLERVLVHGSSGGGMNALAFVGRHPGRTIAAVADCCFARPDTQRRMLFRAWRKMAETMPLDDWADLLTAQVMSPAFLDAHPGSFEQMRILATRTDPYTLRQALLAQEIMDLEPLARGISRPLLLTNMTRDVLCPADLGPSGFGARDIVAANPAHARLVEFEGYGHAPLVEVPDAAVAAVLDFFRAELARERSA